MNTIALTRYFAFLSLLAIPGVTNAGTITVLDVGTATRTMNGGGFGQNDAADYFGEVTNESPLQLNNRNLTVGSSFSPVLGDIIGRDLVSSGINFTGDTITWDVAIPMLPANYCPGTFDLNATFNAGVDFRGAAFDDPSQPNALNFELTFDAISQANFQAQSGTHTSSMLTSSLVDGAPVSSITVTMSFPANSSFNGGTEEFHIFADSLSVDYSFDVVPEPSPWISIVTLLAFVGIRRRL